MVSRLPSRGQSLNSRFGYTSAVGSKSTPTPATNTAALNPMVVEASNYDGQRCLLAECFWKIWVSHTRAMNDSISSAPMPAPWNRPNTRMNTTIANATHSTAIAISASRATSVMATCCGSTMIAVWSQSLGEWNSRWHRWIGNDELRIVPRKSTVATLYVYSLRHPCVRVSKLVDKNEVRP